AHGGEIDDGGHAGEVLEEHARRHERDLALRGTRGLPREERLDVLARHAPAVLAAQQVLEQDLEREGQPRGALAQRVEAIDQELRAADLEDASGVKAVSAARHVATIYASGASFHGGRARFDVYMEAPMTVEGATASFDGGPMYPRCSLLALAAALALVSAARARSEEHTSELQSPDHLVC